MTAPQPKPDDTPLWRGGDFNSEALDAEIKADRRKNNRLYVSPASRAPHAASAATDEDIQRREAAERYLRKGRP